MTTQSSRRVAAFVSAALLGVAAFAVNTTPAHAGAFDGDVTNKLPSSYTVKIADLGGGGSSCKTWNAGTFNCTHWWLPTNKADDQIKGSNFDTDAFMVEQQVLVYNFGTAIRVPAFTWTKIPDGSNVNCYLSPGPVCTVAF